MLSHDLFVNTINFLRQYLPTVQPAARVPKTGGGERHMVNGALGAKVIRTNILCFVL